MQVLVIGGGNGGILREVIKHSTVENIHVCETDEVYNLLIVQSDSKQSLYIHM